MITLLKALLAWLEKQTFVPEPAPSPTTPPELPRAAQTPSPALQPSPASKPATEAPGASGALLWDTPAHAYHATRVLCDNVGLTFDEKNILCACIYQESRFTNTAKHENKSAAGTVLSTDWGICQINDYYHIGTGKDFPSVAYVSENPDKAVAWMISMYQHGLLKQWVSYSSGAYKTWLLPSSPMWKLAQQV